MKRSQANPSETLRKKTSWCPLPRNLLWSHPKSLQFLGQKQIHSNLSPLNCQFANRRALLHHDSPSQIRRNQIWRRIMRALGEKICWWFLNKIHSSFRVWVLKITYYFVSQSFDALASSLSELRGSVNWLQQSR